MPRVSVGDVEIHYCLDDFTEPWKESGVILMHHGYCRNSKFWNPWVPKLAGKCKVLRFDVRGCGESSIPPEGYSWSVEQLAKDALGLIDKLGIQKVHWVGEASGGIMGILFTASYPDRVSSLVICDTPLKFGSQQFSDYSMGQEDPGAALQKMGFKEWCAKTMGHRIDRSKADPKLVQWVESEMLKTPEHVAKSLIRIFARADVSPLLPKIKIPTLVLASSKRTSDWLSHLRVMKEHLPHAHFEVFDDVGPGLHLVIPDRCTSAVLKFLGKIG